VRNASEEADMGMRSRVGSTLESVIGPERTQALRRAERRTRRRMAKRLAPPPARAAKKAGGAGPRRRGGGDVGVGPATARPKSYVRDYPLTPHPTPTMTRHELLAGLHERLRPRTYLEIGIRDGKSLRLSRARSIGVDPAFQVRQELHCDVQLVRATSDDFFDRPDALRHLGGTPVDLAFIDGMHLSEFALRDFLNTEPHMARTGVVVFDDMLPRNPLEAARDRRTSAWAGDVYKAADVLMRRRPDLLVLMVNTRPTGTTVVVRLDPESATLRQAYDEELPYLLAEDPQRVPQEFLDRSIAVDPAELLGSPVWAELAGLRESDDPAELKALWDRLAELPRLGPTSGG
jgi:hypothetical protein